MNWVYDDGGRERAGFKGLAGDCTCRAIAIATRMPYSEVYYLINETARCERRGKRKRSVSSARKGVYNTTMRKVMKALGWTWCPTMRIGSGCQVHLKNGELPNGRLIVQCSRHTVAVINGTIHDLSLIHI